MKNFKNVFFMLLLSATPIISMELPQALQQSNALATLPGDLKREILRMSAQKDGVLNIPVLAEGILALAGTDRALRNAINNPDNMLAILNSFYHKATALYLADKLVKLPAMQSDAVQAWRKGINLEKGNELYQAVTGVTHPSNRAIVKNILRNPNIELNWKNPRYYNRTPLASAAVFGNVPEVELLLAAGANPNLINKDGRSALWEASYNGYRKIVEKLLQAGALVDENIIYWIGRRSYPDIVEIVQKAFAQQQKDKERKFPALQKK